MPKRSKIPKDTVQPLISSQREKLEAQRKQKLEEQIRAFEKKVSESRTFALEQKIKNISDEEEIMMNILDTFKDIEWVPSVGKYYTFIYNAKTEMKEYKGERDLDKVYYDQHPLVAVFRIYRWGFEGLNYHWKKIRRYTWEEVAGPFHVIESKEMDYMKRVKYMKLIKYKLK